MTKSIAIRFSDKLHMEMKLKIVKEGRTIQDYVIGLVKSDLSFDDKNDDLSDYQKKIETARQSVQISLRAVS